MAAKVDVEQVVKLFLSQVGDPYRYGYEIPPGTMDPEAGDCSEYLQWATAMVGIDPPLPDGSWRQYLFVADHGDLIGVRSGVNTRGALLFRFSTTPKPGGTRPKASHVALSLGDGRTMEARSTKRGVGVFSAMRRGWTHAGLIPGAIYAGAGEAGQALLRRVLREGEDGPAVRILQGLLMADGFGPSGLVAHSGLPDGRFGKFTRTHVVLFQTGHGLEPDGIVGPLTWSALLYGSVAK